MEIKSIVGDGMYTFAIIAQANTRHRYRMRRSTGAVQIFTGGSLAKADKSNTGARSMRD